MILRRDGKVVIRPDSGNPVDIIAGRVGNRVNTAKGDVYYTDSVDTWGPIEHKGVIELLWDIFGGTVNSKGYKVLDPHIGAIYGDAITYERADKILERLAAKGFAASNIVFGTGSFTYQYNTRDTYGFAMKATYGELYIGINPDGDKTYEGREIYKDPITGDGTEKSLRGLVKVYWDEENNQYAVKDQCTWDEEREGELITVFEDSVLTKTYSFKEVRENLNGFTN